MKKKHVFILTLFMFASCMYVTQAQQAVLASGGNATGSGGTVSYSIGQVVYSAVDTQSGFIIEGVQQPLEVTDPTVNIEKVVISLSASVYPNPSTDYLYLKIEEYPIESTHFHLYDQNGKLLQSKKITDLETQISMKEYQSAMYFVTVTDNKKEIKTFKVIKR